MRTVAGEMICVFVCVLPLQSCRLDGWNAPSRAVVDILVAAVVAADNDTNLAVLLPSICHE